MIAQNQLLKYGIKDVNECDHIVGYFERDGHRELKFTSNNVREFLDVKFECCPECGEKLNEPT